ncbi:hypothetical protein EFP84_06200 [Leptospira kmetyi]|uniref:Uncharacterized protein n=1 Tax=Leptospira kmetyi TaxID=408139 RepID=A0AAD0UNS1_9LEPT|nr:hypothetical protein EFP84_06200 [Leptospira kmetyi]EQA53861.1 hypothetical protein LEP1GSC052_2590 [Leptospira kmetyi serovar Malaysia str. Bejo-Iso9]
MPTCRSRIFGFGNVLTRIRFQVFLCFCGSRKVQELKRGGVTTINSPVKRMNLREFPIEFRGSF